MGEDLNGVAIRFYPRSPLARDKSIPERPAETVNFRPVSPEDLGVALTRPKARTIVAKGSDKSIRCNHNSSANSSRCLDRRRSCLAPEDLMLYEYDGSVEQASPSASFFPLARATCRKLCGSPTAIETPLVGRGAGTGLSGGAIARNGGIVVVFSRMNRILEIDAANLRAVVQPGVVNLDLSRAVEHLGLYFAPDPSSQKSCTIGGNVSENSGGPHTLAYGVTANHVTGLELVLPDGEIVRIGGKNIETRATILTACSSARKERSRWSRKLPCG